MQPNWTRKNIASRLSKSLLAAALLLAAGCSREPKAPYLVYVTNEGSGDLTVIDNLRLGAYARRGEADRFKPLGVLAVAAVTGTSQNGGLPSGDLGAIDGLPVEHVVSDAGEAVPA